MLRRKTVGRNDQVCHEIQSMITARLCFVPQRQRWRKSPDRLGNLVREENSRVESSLKFRDGEMPLSYPYPCGLESVLSVFILILG